MIRQRCAICRGEKNALLVCYFVDNLDEEKIVLESISTSEHHQRLKFLRVYQSKMFNHFHFYSLVSMSTHSLSSKLFAP